MVNANRSLILKTIELFHSPGNVVEVRIPHAGKYKTVSGYFDNFDRLADAVMSQADQSYPGYYFTTNPINSALLARSNNRLISFAKTTTSDADVTKLRWLLIDLDPIRPAGISSTDEEHEAAILKAREIRSYLIENCGWSPDAFILADSGNGGHLPVKIGPLENTPSNVELLQRCLKALDFAFSDGTVKVDTSTFNPARIWKIYGTPARKGDDMPDRPHRTARLLEVPDNLSVINFDLLENLASILPNTGPVGNRQSLSDNFDPEAWAHEHALDISKVKSWNGGTLVELEVCPFNSDHIKTARIGVLSNGARYFGCFHDTCKARGWNELRDLLDPPKNAIQKGSNQEDSGEEAKSPEPGSKGTAGTTVSDAILAMAIRCDGARSLDGQGFDKFDVDYFKPLIEKINSGAVLDLYIQRAAKARLKRYASQLANYGVDFESLVVEGENLGALISHDDVVVSTGKSERLSPTRACNEVLAKMELAMSLNSNSIFIYDGQIWNPNGAEIIDAILCESADDLVTKKALDESLRRIRNVLRSQPVNFDSNPYLFPALDGVVDLRTGEVRETQAQDYLTFKYNAKINDGAANWQPFLWFLCSSLPESRDVLTVLDIMAAIAIRLPFDIIVLLFGGGANGKGILEKVILALFTQSRASAISLDEMKRSRFGPGAVLGRNVWIVTEVETIKDAMSVLKKISTGELIDSDVKYGARVQGRPHLVPILDANIAFDYGDDSYGRRRRVIKLDFPYTFGDAQGQRHIDRNLEEKLIRPEVLSGIARIIAARARYLEHAQCVE